MFQRGGWLRAFQIEKKKTKQNMFEQMALVCVEAVQPLTALALCRAGEVNSGTKLENGI